VKRRRSQFLCAVTEPGEVGHWGTENDTCSWKDDDGSFWRIDVIDGVAYTLCVSSPLPVPF